MSKQVDTETSSQTSPCPCDPFLLKPGLLEVINRGSVKKSALSLDEKVEIALKVGQECINTDELRRLFEHKEVPICYDGFEPSGRMHIAQGILKAINVNRLTSAGCVFVFWIADWFAMLNNKMNGDLQKIRRVGEYFINVWKAAGMDLENVRFLWTSEEIARDPNAYWSRVMDISRRNTISRIKRCGQIMGRTEGDDQPAAQVLYPCMQCSDIFYIGADICQLGMDQRKVNMLAREYVDAWNTANKKHSDKKLRKPIILSHAMLPGLLENQEKMSKSIPESAIFMEDSPDEVRRKIKRAFCPPGIVDGNPVVAYIEMIVFPKQGLFHIERTEQNGGNVSFDCVDEFKEAFAKGELHPSDVKTALASALNEMLEPVRQHFKNDPEARQLLQDLQRYKTTR